MAVEFTKRGTVIVTISVVLTEPVKVGVTGDGELAACADAKSGVRKPSDRCFQFLLGPQNAGNPVISDRVLGSGGFD